MAIDTALCTQALSHLAITKVVTEATITASPEGLAIQTYYEQARQQVLRERPWAFATAFADLTLATTEPTNEWGFAYHTPADHLAIKRIVVADRTRNTRVRPAYRLVRDFVSTAWDIATEYTAGQWASVAGVWYRALRDTVGDDPLVSTSDWVLATTPPPKLLLTDEATCEIEYTLDVTTLTEWDPHARSAFAFLLAFMIAPRVTAGDPYKLRASALEMYQWHLRRAMAIDGNEEQPDEPMVSDFERAR